MYLAYRGSISHGTQSPGPTSIDDIDLIGFVLAQPRHYLGLTEWGSRGTREIKSGRWDIVLYEIRKATQMLLQGNPNIVSALWTAPKHNLLLSDAGRKLIENRHLFDGRHIYHSFAGYSSAQMHKMESRSPAELREYLAITYELKHRGKHPNYAEGEVWPEPDRSTGEARDIANWNTDKLLARMRHFQKKGENIGYMGEKRKQLVLKHGYDAKNVAHAIRLLRMCIEYLRTGEMLVERPDAEELRAIKTGKWDLARVKTHAADLFLEAKSAYENSTLPDQPDRVGAEKLLIEILEDHLRRA